MITHFTNVFIYSVGIVFSNCSHSGFSQIQITYGIKYQAIC